MSIKFHIIVPARLASSRLPGKLLLDIAGKTVIERVCLQALQSHPATLVVATDSMQIYEHVNAIGVKVVLTSASHASGTDRIAEVVGKLDYHPDDIIVNLQGDEPFIDRRLIIQVAACLANNQDLSMATLCWPIFDTELLNNPHVVKVVRDRFNFALYFSRQAIPAWRDKPVLQLQRYKFLRHIGIYAYRAAFLLELVQIPPCDLELLESLEQLRVLWMGHKIYVDDATVAPTYDINTAQDLQLARQFIASLGEV